MSTAHLLRHTARSPAAQGLGPARQVQHRTESPLAKRRRSSVMVAAGKLLQDKLCLVTGASRGIGAAIAEAYAKEGGRLILVAEEDMQAELDKVAKSCKDKGASSAEVMLCDMSFSERVDQLCKDIMAQHQAGIDVLVNNAASLGPIDYKKGDNMGQGPLDGNPDEWQRTLNINVVAPQRTVRWLVPAMKERGQGWVISINSTNGLHPSAGTPAYCTSKWGSRGWSLSCHEALKEFGIKCTTIYPPATSTNMTWDRPDMEQVNEMEAQVEDVAEAALLPFKMSGNALPVEIIIQTGKKYTK